MVVSQKEKFDSAMASGVCERGPEEVVDKAVGPKAHG